MRVIIKIIEQHIQPDGVIVFEFIGTYGKAGLLVQSAVGKSIAQRVVHDIILSFSIIIIIRVFCTGAVIFGDTVIGFQETIPAQGFCISKVHALVAAVGIYLVALVKVNEAIGGNVVNTGLYVILLIVVAVTVIKVNA